MSETSALEHQIIFMRRRVSLRGARWLSSVSVDTSPASHSEKDCTRGSGYLTNFRIEMAPVSDHPRVHINLIAITQWQQTHSWLPKRQLSGPNKFSVEHDSILSYRSGVMREACLRRWITQVYADAPDGLFVWLGGN